MDGSKDRACAVIFMLAVSSSGWQGCWGTEGAYWDFTSHVMYGAQALRNIELINVLICPGVTARETKCWTLQCHRHAECLL